MIARGGALAVTLAGVGLSAVTTAGALATILADAAGQGSDELAPYLTGGGALSLTAVLGYIAIKLARGELVPRDVRANEAALTKLAGGNEALAESNAQLAAASNELLRDTLEELALSRAHRATGGPAT